MIAYFVGIAPGRTSGHYCYTPGYAFAVPGPGAPPSPWIDDSPGGYPLGDDAPCRRAWGPHHQRLRLFEQVEGQGRLFREAGWTLLHLWDRSGPDLRPGCHASFAFEAAIERADNVCTLVNLHFPGMLARIEGHLGRPITIEDRS